MRGIYAAGILHAFGTAGFDPFDLYIGVSAGACHLASHLAGQNDRNFDITLRYSLEPRFISLGRFLRGGHLMDLDWMWHETITNYRLDLKHIDEKIHAQNREYLVVATSMETGRPLYLRPDAATLEHYLKVSNSLPIFYRSTLDVNGQKATDGGMADSIPVREAHRRGAINIAVIRTRPSHYLKKSSHAALVVFNLYFRKYPKLVECFRKRAANYNASVEFMENPPEGVRITQLTPPAELSLGRTTTDEAQLHAAYEKGIDHGRRFMESYISG